MTPEQAAPAESRRVGRDSIRLAVGSIVNGLFAYLFVILGTRSLGAEEFSAVAVLWGFWAFSGAALAFPIQHWVVRQMEIDGGAAGVAAALLPLASSAAAVAAGEGLVALILRDRLFGTSSWFWPVAVIVLALGTALLGLVKGLLAGSKRFGSAAAVIGGENVVRVAAAIIVMAVWNTPEGFAVALLTGAILGPVWPGMGRLLRVRLGERPTIRLVGASGAGLLFSQVILHGGPIVLAAMRGEPADVTILFSTLALFRAPYLIALGLTLRSTGPFTRLVLERAYRSIARVALMIAAAAGAIATLAAMAAFAVGPPVVAFVFGAAIRPERWVSAVIAAGSILAIAGLWQVIGLISADRERALVLSWLTAIVLAGIALAVGPGSAMNAVVVAFLVGESVAVVAMALSLAGWARRRSAEQGGGR